MSASPRHHCPHCETPGRVLETRLTIAGSRRRRLCCSSESCGHRWTEWDGPRPTRSEYVIAGRARKKSEPGRWTRITEGLVRFLLTRTDLSHSAASRATGANYETIRQIRLGRLRAETCPELPRWHPAPNLTCCECDHWRGSACGMGLPDPEEEGVAFAADCALFSPAASAGRSPAAAAGSERPAAG